MRLSVIGQYLEVYNGQEVWVCIEEEYRLCILDFKDGQGIITSSSYDKTFRVSCLQRYRDFAINYVESLGMKILDVLDSRGKGKTSVIKFRPLNKAGYRETTCLDGVKHENYIKLEDKNRTYNGLVYTDEDTSTAIKVCTGFADKIKNELMKKFMEQANSVFFICKSGESWIPTGLFENYIMVFEDKQEGIIAYINRSMIQVESKLTLNIPEKWHSRVVGKGGENIRRIKDDLKVQNIKLVDGGKADETQQ